VEADDRSETLDSLRQSIEDSEESLREMRHTIEVVDARLKRTRRDKRELQTKERAAAI
jgi:hypothetical protein